VVGSPVVKLLDSESVADMGTVVMVDDCVTDVEVSVSVVVVGVLVV
jgi:hypothetical protein